MMLSSVLLLGLFSQSFAQVDSGAMVGDFSCGTPPPPDGSKTRGAAGDGIILWANNIVRYEIDSSFTAIDIFMFKKSRDFIEANTCVKFEKKPAGWNGPYLKLQRECDCGSQNAGCFRGGYTDGLGSATPRNLVMSAACLPDNAGSLRFFTHEMMHALGVIHTQNRPDRDYFVKLDEHRINQTGSASQYKKCSTCDTYDTPYNCMSAMHYRSQMINGGPTMTALYPETCDLWSQTFIEDSDWDLINQMYCRDQNPIKKCDGGSDDEDCCSETNKCGQGEGDCGADYECQAGLFCGYDNCKNTNPSADPYADCCTSCMGASDDWNCCSSTYKCGFSEGHCDTDAQCEDGLICGFNNCKYFHPEAIEETNCCV